MNINQQNRLHALDTHKVIRARWDEPDLSALVRLGYAYTQPRKGGQTDFRITGYGAARAAELFGERH